MSNNYHLDMKYFDQSPAFDGISLIQIGRRFCDYDTRIDEHVQGQFIELTVVTGGLGDIITNGTATRVRQGDIYLSIPCDLHTIISDSEDPLRYDYLSFSVEDSELLSDFDRIFLEYHNPELRIIHDERIPPLLVEAISEIKHDSQYSHRLLSAIFKQIAIYTIRAFCQTQSKYPKDLTDNETICYQLMNYIDTHIYSIRYLEEVSDSVGYSHGYASVVFKKTTGDTLYHYYLHKRMETACMLLKEGRFSSTEIAERLGYSSLYAFSNAFKHSVGISPKEYRAQHKK